jgi:exosortase
MHNVVTGSSAILHRWAGAVRSGWRGRPSGSALRLALVLAALAMCVLWAYWPTLVAVSERWSDDPQYSHGFLVPVFALVILWSRREMRPRTWPRSSWWGLPLLLLAGLMRFIAAYFYFAPLDGLALLPALLGVCLLTAGWPALRWCWPALAFLSFMLPLPYQVEITLAQPLRGLATAASTYVLQTLGFPAFAEGNVILLGEFRLGVIDACSGLGMLFTFFALATAVAVVIQRPLFDRLVIVASAVPIALVVNIARITLTSMVHVWLGEAIGKLLMHDLAGWLMMPMALGLVWLELWFLSRLLLEPGPAAPMPLTLDSLALPAPYPKRERQSVPLPPLPQPSRHR